MVTQDRWSLNTGLIDVKCTKIKHLKNSYNTSYCLIEVITKAGLTVHFTVGFDLVFVYGVQRHFQQYFCYIVAVSFIVGGNKSTRRKPPTCRKSLKISPLNVESSYLAMNGVRTHNY
jgi:hypothetical protein